MAPNEQLKEVISKKITCNIIENTCTNSELYSIILALILNYTERIHTKSFKDDFHPKRKHTAIRDVKNPTSKGKQRKKERHHALKEDRHIPCDHSQQHNAVGCSCSCPKHRLQHPLQEGFGHTSTEIKSNKLLIIDQTFKHYEIRFGIFATTSLISILRIEHQ